jgi:phage terminase Nu1 subunit (DNA packaging protein)
MTRFLNNLQQVRSKSKVWKVVSMTRFWNNLQHVSSKSAYLLQVIPETRHVHYFPNH